ncbi:MAG: UDP-N-acetylmuramoyl-tripeptide--D-alanyl-D-alanine ligase [Firmicutes bacterium]|nr:UDP-N-acetylmuramoyl-tripeptide--D-alanyl-D-alanine ligase [Bacillota bacterium]
MNHIYVKDILEKCDGYLVIGDENTKLENFSKDTRTLNNGDIYVGIKGETFDGSTLYKDALDKGALGCVLNKGVLIDEEFLKKYSDRFIVLVEDTIKCLQELASYKRSLYDIPVIGVTGSVGKTSTKDIIASVLSKKFNVLKTEGNYNNHIGLPLTILRLKEHNALVVEMGMNNLGEISLLSKIARPNVGVITNVGTAHIGILKSRENILKAKLEILEGMDESSVLVINNDNDMLHNWYEDNRDNYNIVTFGVNNKSDYIASGIISDAFSSNYKVNINNVENDFKINIPGEHFVLNGVCALSIGKLFNISIEDIKDGIENFALTKRRMQIENINNITIINDCYNANLDSMSSAINYLGSLKDFRTIAVLGDMLELGDYEEELHRKVGKVIKENNIDILVTIGNASKYIKDEAIKLGYNINNIFSFDNNEEGINKLKNIIKENDAILIKASNGMNFIEIYNGLKETLE